MYNLMMATMMAETCKLPLATHHSLAMDTKCSYVYDCFIFTLYIVINAAVVDIHSRVDGVDNNNAV